MQTVSAGLAALYDQAVEVKAVPQVICEWNHNIYANSITVGHDGPSMNKEPTSVTTQNNVTTFSGDPTVDPTPSLYPIQSIILPRRPGSGTPKARVGKAKAAGKVSNYHYRTLGPTAKYQYWESSTVSSGATISNANPYVTYGNARSTNKIQIGFETTQAYPVGFSVQTWDGTTWTTIATNPTIDSTGRVILYYQGSSWSSAYNASNSTNIMGIKVVTTTLSASNSRVSVIEISARLVKDLSADVISMNISKSMQAYDVSAPFGTNSANTCGVVLDNTTGIYDENNAAGPYYTLLDTNAKLTVGYIVDASAYGGSATEYVPQGIFYVDSWAPNTTDTTVQVSGTDYAKFLQTQPMPERLFISYSVPQIIAEICRSVGLSSYSIDFTAEGEFDIPFVWYSDTDTVWSAIAELCQTTQSAVFFDETGQLVYLSRNTLYAQTTPDYALSAVNNGSVLANVTDLTEQFNVQANKVVVKYTAAHANQTVSRTDPNANRDDIDYFENFVSQIYPTEYDLTNSKPVPSVLWSPPEATLVLQAAYLNSSMTATATYMYIDPNRAQEWHWTGKLNIEGELLSWSGKEYKWYKNGVAQYTIVTDLAGQIACDKSCDQYLRATNRYTGKLTGLVRGLNQTTPAAHNVDIRGWTHTVKSSTNTFSSGNSYVRQDASTMIQTGPDTGSYQSYLYSLRGSNTDSYTAYGTRLRFARYAGKAFTGGLVFNLQSDGLRGYYIEIKTTHMSVDVLKGTTGEVRAYSMNTDGSQNPLGDDISNPIHGLDTFIAEGGAWVDVDIVRESTKYSIYINGRYAYSFTDSTYTAGRFGVFARGNSSLVYEYVYINNTSTPAPIGQSSVRSAITGGYESGYAMREVIRNKNNQVLWFLDDFGPICHEYREFDVRFDKFPAVLALPYLTNYWRAAVIESNFTPFGGKFAVANTARDLAIIQGGDTGIFPGKELKQTSMVYGQLVMSDSQRTRTIQDKVASRRHGEISYELNNRWVQTDEQAKEVAQFMIDHLGTPCDVISVNGFLSPAVQVGDLVSVNWPARNMTTTNNKYHVLDIQTGFSTGISTSLTLRRAR